METIEIKNAISEPMHLFVFKPIGATGPTPVVFAIHGGGGVFGHPLMDTPIYTRFAQAGYAVVSPDYRLAPEHPSPAAGNDIDVAWSVFSNSLL